jgi:hypothetical protein
MTLKLAFPAAWSIACATSCVSLLTAMATGFGARHPTRNGSQTMASASLLLNSQQLAALFASLGSYAHC